MMKQIAYYGTHVVLGFALTTLLYVQLAAFEWQSDLAPSASAACHGGSPPALPVARSGPRVASRNETIGRLAAFKQYGLKSSEAVRVREGTRLARSVVGVPGVRWVSAHENQQRSAGPSSCETNGSPRPRPRCLATLLARPAGVTASRTGARAA